MTQAASLRLFAAALALTSAVLLGVSCLNPRPEELPSAGGDQTDSHGPGAMVPTGENPGIGGDNLSPGLDDGDDLPIEPGNPENPGDSNSPIGNGGSTSDAGLGPSLGIPGPDAGPDGG